jgi:hypothetical protein
MTRPGSFVAASSMSVARCACIDQRLAADGAGGEVLRVRVERDGAGFTGRGRHDEISMRFGDIAAVGHHLCLTNLEGGG